MVGESKSLESSLRVLALRCGCFGDAMLDNMLCKKTEILVVLVGGRKRPRMRDR
jgi:hypothetical protein